MKRFEWIFVVIVFVVVSLIMFWSLLPNLNKYVIGDGGDICQFLWNFWHFKQSVLTSSNPLISNDIFYPLRINLLLHVITPVKSIMAVPLLTLFNVKTTYNLLLIFSFTATAVGTYLLIKSYFNNSLIAFIGGFSLAFAPNQMAHALGHFNLISIEAIPWIFYVWRSHQEVPKKWKTLILALLSVYLFLCDYYLLLYLVLVSIIYLVYKRIISGGEFKHKAVQMLCVLSIFIILLSPLWIMLIPQLTNYNTMSLHDPGWASSKIFCADLLSLLMPSELHPWWGNKVTSIYETFKHQNYQGVGHSYISERNLGFGLVILFGTLFGIIKYWKDKYIQMWFWIGTVFFILALGPVLYLGGISLNYFPNLPFKIIFPMPYMLIHYIPLVNGLRIPGRFIIVTIMAATMIFSYVLAKVYSREISLPVNKKVLIGLIFILIAVEYMPPKYPMAEMNIPNIYDVIKADANKNNVVLDLPSPPWNYDLKPLYYQTYHGHKMVGGWTARFSTEQDRYINKYNVIAEISKNDSHIKPSDLIKVIRELDVKYIVVRGKSLIGMFDAISRDLPDIVVAQDLTEIEETKMWEVK